MKVDEIVTLIGAAVLNPEVPLDRDVKGGCGADLMSDVLAAMKPEAVLLTGLCNIQVIRTAQMADICAVIFVRGKLPQSDVIELATQENIPLISSQYGTFELCGRLHKAGLPSAEMVIPSEKDA